MVGGVRRISLAGFGLVAGLAAATPATAAQSDPEWPCIQVLVPRIASGQIWTGPPVEPVAQAWREDPAVRELALELAARRTPIETAREQIEAFATSLDPEVKDEKLTALFAGVLETINQDRASLIAGIKRFARTQQRLGDQVREANAALRELEGDDASQRQALQEQRDWTIRIFNEREDSLTHLCEQPVVLERRAFALAREIASHLG